MQAKVEVELDEAARKQLETICRSRTLDRRLVLRARIVLLAAEGLSYRKIGEQLKIDYKTAMLWRNRFAARGFAGIEKELPGRGRKPQIQADEVLDIVRRTLLTQPEDAGHWSLRRMAQDSGLSKSTIHRIWQSRGLKPHLFKNCKPSGNAGTEPLQDVVGLA
jgi:transposase